MWWWPQTSGELAQWLEAIGTMLAVIAALGIALFQDKWRIWLHRPKLDVSIELKPPDCLKTKLYFNFNREVVTSFVAIRGEMMEPASADAYYFKLRVTNSGAQKAESVEVFAAELSKRQADGTFKLVDSFSPMNLLWSYVREIFFPAISPGTYKHCTLAHIIDPKERGQVPGEDNQWPNIRPEKTILSFDTIVKPFTLGYLVPFGTYRLVIMVAASNAKAVKKTLEITLTGDWYDDEQEMLGQGIRIRLLD